MTTPILVRCSATGLMAQLLIERDEVPAEHFKEYRAIECPACSGFHLVNIATGKLMSDEIKD